ncbi:ABC transporter permease [Alloscardovia theropitheci]|uniref:ABC transporter permease n=1 Tax=Alloscardovia theropitheci TaxID=2496842 RepID=A0A4V2MTX9_9BIFI|nr:TraX family protein [Alloscardovia theropitheci]TCD54209.1 ABC transporter permease [Alloscardovia theropitheci]
MSTSPSHRVRGLSHLRLKIIATVLFAFSLLSGVIINSGINIQSSSATDMTNLTTAVLFEAISWTAIPLYAWLLVEGYKHTHNRWLYGIRLFILALVCELPYDKVTTGHWVDWNSQNPVFAMVIALAALALIDYYAAEGSRMRWLVITIIALFGLLWMIIGHIGVRQRIMQSGILLFLLVLIFHLLDKRENTMMMTAAILGACFFITPALGVAVLHYHNDTLGYDAHKSPWIQWAFYAFYPLLLLVSTII